jgi:5-methylcytosine-specific restriction enzyme A
VARSRKDAWLRDELVLALDRYMRSGRNAPGAEVEELSALLRGIPVESKLTNDPAFRGTQSVYLKLANYAAIDPASGIAGLSRGGRSDREVWDEFGASRARLASAATAIRANIAELAPNEAETEEDGIAEAAEGRILTRLHRARERNSKLTSRRKAEAKMKTGGLTCEACGFDFAAVYGTRGEDFIEYLRGPSRTRALLSRL